jgi:hypothetical protein
MLIWGCGLFPKGCFAGVSFADLAEPRFGGAALFQRAAAALIRREGAGPF